MKYSPVYNLKIRFTFVLLYLFHKGLKNRFAALLLADRNWIKAFFFFFLFSYLELFRHGSELEDQEKYILIKSSPVMYEGIIPVLENVAL